MQTFSTLYLFIHMKTRQSGVVETSTPVTSKVRVRFPVEAGLYVIEWATLFYSVGLLRGLGFPPTYQNRPVLFDEQL